MMRTTLIVIAMMIGAHLNNCSLATGQALDPLSEANRYFTERNYQAAVNIYQRILATNLDVPAKVKVWFNLGMTYQKLARYDDAINAFTEILDMDVNDREPGGNIMEPYRNYRSRAQWEVANSLFAKGDYRGALEAYQTTRLKYPVESWCNVERQTAQYAYALREGLSYEYLGLYREAVDSYLRIYAPRLVNLYEAAGQLDDLKEIVSRRDRAYLASLANQLSTPVSPEDLKRYRPSQILHDILEIHALGEAHDWPALFNQLRDWSKGGGDGRQDEVVRMISRYPKETVPLLKKELGQFSVPPYLMYEALGLTGTSDAVAALKNKAKKEENIWSAMSLVHALSVAGKPGQKALKELDKIATHNLRIAIDKYKSGELQEQYETVRFPPIPSKLALPRDI